MADIKQLEKDIHMQKKLSIKDIHNFLQTSYILERKYLNDNDANWKHIQHIQDYLQYKYNKHEEFKSRILTLIATIFLPLGVIVGFFGMNFKSMGAPALKNKGVFNIKHADKFVFWMAIFSIIVISLIFVELTYH